MLESRAGQIILKTDAQVELMRVSGRLVAQTLQEVVAMVRPGRRLAELDQHVQQKYERLGVVPTFKGYQGYPYTICASVNEQIVHGFPTDRILEEGDLFSIDLGATVDGWVADAAVTVGVGRVSPEAQRLLDATREALEVGIDTARVGVRKGDIGAAIQAVLEGAGYGVVREYVGHGVGREMHEPPSMPNFGKRGSGMIMRKGMVVALEPMATIGSAETTQLGDGWTVVTKDGTLAAHFEHTMALRLAQPADVLTRCD